MQPGGRASWRTYALLAAGVAAFVVAGLSVADMFLPRPYDGVVLATDAPGELTVQQVMVGSGAHRAGIRPGDRIRGIGREVLESPGHAAAVLNTHAIGDRVPYLVSSGGRLREVAVELGRRRVGDSGYLYATVLGFCFFFVGLFVLLRQPRMGAARVFFTLSVLFLLFLVCRLRPASYSWVDSFVLTTGTAALLMLPALFVHFFLIFPRPLFPRLQPMFGPNGISPLLRATYAVPPLVYLTSVGLSELLDVRLPTLSGAPIANWWVMAVAMILGLAALAFNAGRLEDSREQHGAVLVFVGTLFGVMPFLVLAIAFPSFLNTDRFVFYGVVPLILVPITFAYAIVRFQLLDIRVIVRKSLLYTATTAVVTALYALGIASFNTLFRGTTLAAAPYFPIVFALAIVLLFEPLRRQIQVPVDRFFFGERQRLQRALVELGEALTGRPDLEPVVRELVQRLPELLGLHFAGLYLVEGDTLRRAAGPEALPERLPALRYLHDHLRRRGSLVLLDQIGALQLISPEVDRVVDRLSRSGVEVIGDLASARRWIGTVVLSGKSGQMRLEEEELRLLRSLLDQASIALETSILLEDRARRAELERELEIAASIQDSLLPETMQVPPGWQVSARCRPAREVGGDFYTELPCRDGCLALAYGDVSGKSVPGALMMMAAHEILHSLALTESDPERILELANRRLHRLRRRSFVALGYLRLESDGLLSYALAGQPDLLVRSASGEVRELPYADHRLPLGALGDGRYRLAGYRMQPGDVLISYTDGVTEAQRSDGEVFGMERLMAMVAEGPGTPDGAVNHLLDAVEAFVEGGEPYDDITVVAVARSGHADA